MTSAPRVSSRPVMDIRRLMLREPDPSGRLRLEIQALRAVAVIIVVVYHFWPQRLPGGYVGVDVFFVISGYLIIGALLREVDAAGRVRLVDFWARRARRLIPASLATLLAVTVAVVVWVPQVYWIQYIREIGAAAFYLLNWLLAANSVDYLASQNVPSPVQHFWSLSVEEQFYIAWPILIVVVGLIVRRKASRSRAIVLILVLVVVASAVYSVIATDRNQASAYFITTTRAWEFGVGGLLAAFSGPLMRIPRRVAPLLAWGGLSMIAFAALRFSPATQFPGYVAWLPVVGALLIIVAGLPAARWSPRFLYGLRFVQWTGDISYSLYLWHWPLLVIVPIALHRDIGTVTKLILVAVAFVLAWVSKVFIEDPARSSAAIRRRGPWFATVATVVVTGLILVGSIGWTSSMQAQSAVARQQALKSIASDGTSCVGAGAFGPNRIACPRPFAVTALTDPLTAATDIGRGVQVSDKCKQDGESAVVVTCRLGQKDHVIHHVALIGDSHAGVLLEPLQIYADQHDWRITTFLKTWCAGTGAPGVAAPDNLDVSGVRSCAQWGASALGRIMGDPSIDTVVFSNFTRHYASGDVSGLGNPVTSADFIAAWTQLKSAGKKVIVIRDIPDAGSTPVPQCVAQAMSEYDPCATPRDVAVTTMDPEWSAAQSTPGVIGIDLTDDFCDATLCHSVIGGLIVYFDYHHLTATFARTMAPYLGDDIAAAIR